jgi:hypothetical protein
MKKSELQQIIREEIQELTFGQKGINPQNNPKGDLMGKINDLLDGAERQIGPEEVASVINVLYQRYRRYL